MKLKKKNNFEDKYNQFSFRYYDDSRAAHKITYEMKQSAAESRKEDNATKFLNYFSEFLSFLILFNYLIPISLYVTIEMHKFLGSLFLEWDLDMYDVSMNQRCLVNTSNLNEELGQVNPFLKENFYIHSNKLSNSHVCR